MVAHQGPLTQPEHRLFQNDIEIAIVRIWQPEIASLTRELKQFKPIEHLPELVKQALEDTTFVTSLKNYQNQDKCILVADKVAHMLTDETRDKINAQIKNLSQNEIIKPWLERDANLAKELENSFKALCLQIELRRIYPILHDIEESIIPHIPAQLNQRDLLDKRYSFCNLI